ncbi:MAG: polysaccharide biosynthesis tyrosine autokinase [Anaerolineae bacterium]|nr:polysaccharide biosynthesis tyrosine autokinase [Anaerolineae bacterium]
MELSGYLQILKRRKLVVIVTLVAALVVAVAISSQLPATYRATATLRMLTSTSGSADYLQYDVRYAERLMNTYANLATSQPVLDELARQLNLAEAPKATVSMITNTELLEIAVEDSDPELARDAANTLSAILIAEARARYEELSKATSDTLSVELAQSQADLEQTRQDYEAALGADYPDAEQIQILRDLLTLREGRYTTLLAQYERIRALVELQAPSISVVEPARTPRTPSQPQKPLILGLAGLLGLSGGLGLAFLLEALDTRIYSKSQIASLSGSPILGEIPALSRQRRAGFFSDFSIQQEAVHRLSVSLFPPEAIRNRRSARQVLLVTSATLGDGKSTVAANLGVAVARSGYKTLLIDADARRPALHRVFGLPNESGLSTILAGETEARLGETIHPSAYKRLHVLTSGPWTPDFFALLGSAAMADLRRTLLEHFDVILIDSPAFLAVADGAILASLVDSVLLVLRLGYVRRDTLLALLEQLANLDIASIDIVLNCTPGGDAHRDYRQKTKASPRSVQRKKTGPAERPDAQDAAHQAAGAPAEE